MKKIAEETKFSKNLLELSALRESIVVTNKYSNQISSAHGPLVKLDNLNILYDLRNYKSKPIFGHSHPLFIKYKSEVKSQLAQNINEISKDNYEVDFFCTNNFLPLKNIDDDYFLNFFFDGKNYLVTSEIFRDYPLKLFVSYFEISLLKGQRLKSIQDSLRYELENINTDIAGNSLSFLNPHSLTKDDLVRYNIYTNTDNFIDNKIILHIPVTITNTQLSFLLSKLKLIPGII